MDGLQDEKASIFSHLPKRFKKAEIAFTMVYIRACALDSFVNEDCL